MVRVPLLNASVLLMMMMILMMHVPLVALHPHLNGKLLFWEKIQPEIMLAFLSRKLNRLRNCNCQFDFTGSLSGRGGGENCTGYKSGMNV